MLYYILSGFFDCLGLFAKDKIFKLVRNTDIAVLASGSCAAMRPNLLYVVDFLL